MAKREKIKYTERNDYFPESIRKKFKIGEYAEDDLKENIKKADEKAVNDLLKNRETNEETN